MNIYGCFGSKVIKSKVHWSKVARACWNVWDIPGFKSIHTAVYELTRYARSTFQHCSSSADIWFFCTATWQHAARQLQYSMDLSLLINANSEWIEIELFVDIAIRIFKVRHQYVDEWVKFLWRHHYLSLTLPFVFCVLQFHVIPSLVTCSILSRILVWTAPLSHSSQPKWGSNHQRNRCASWHYHKLCSMLAMLTWNNNKSFMLVKIF